MSEATDRYPWNPLDGPARMAEMFKEINRRISALEGAPLVGSQMTVKDTAGNVRVRLGALEDGTSYGIEIQNENARDLLRVTNEGQTFPYTFMPWTSVAATYGFTSASYTEIFRCDFSCSGPRVDYDLNADAAGGAMDFRIQIAEFGAALTDAVEQVAASGQHAGNFTIPPAALLSGTDPQGRVMSIRVQGRRTSGAGTPTLRLNGPLYNRPS